MTSLDPSHLPTDRGQDHVSRGQDVYRRASGGRALPIPDLRFEHSYLRSLQRFIHDADRRHERSEKGGVAWTAGENSGIEAAAPGLYGVPLRFDWGWIIYITARDQVLSPLAQGAVWALVSHFLRPSLRSLGSWVHVNVVQSWRSVFQPLDVKGGASRTNNPLREFIVGGIGTNIALAK